MAKEDSFESSFGDFQKKIVNEGVKNSSMQRRLKQYSPQLLLYYF